VSITKSYAQSPQAFSEMDDLSNCEWLTLAFKNIDNQTDYQLIEKHGQQVIYARTDNSASLLVTPLDKNTATDLNIKWRWKVSNIYQAGDANSKSGDDYPARIYIAFAFDPEAATFIEKLKYNAANAMTEDTLPGSALNYIWANKLSVGQIVTNPYSEQTKMIAVQSGEALLGQWVDNARNIAADYQAAFGREPPPIIAIGIMSDSDNTGEAAEAWYGDIIIE
jgi:hypothetical protein